MTGETVSRYQYGYDSGANAKGLRTSQTRTLEDGTAQTVNYEYDEFYRLARAGSWDGSTLAYEYDIVGNIESVAKIKDGATVSSETYVLYGGTSPHAGMNRLHQVWRDMNGDGDTADSGDHVVEFDYDANGNLTGRDIAYPNGGGTNEAWSYGYDADDRMVSLVKDASTVVEYGYDALGRRTWAKEPGSAAEVYFYDSEDRLQTRRGSASVETVLHGPGIDDYIGARDSGGAVRYMLTDGLGSVTERTSQAGSLTWRAEYEPFGAASVTLDTGSLGLAATATPAG